MGFLPPSSSEQPISCSAHWPGDQLAGGGGTGEADVVGALDQRAADVLARPGDDLPEVPWEAGLLEQLRAEQRREHGLGVGLDHHRVAGHQGGQAVAESQGEGVVPGGDDPDHALGQPVHLDAGQPGEHAGHPAGGEVVRGGTGVVARGQGDVGQLEEGVLAGLAGLDADQVADLVLTVQDQVVQPQQRLRALLDRRPRPGLLRPAGAGHGLPDVLGRGLRDVRHRLAVERRLDRRGLAAGRHDASGQVGDVVGLEGVGRPGVVLGVGRTVDQRSSSGGLGGHETESM